MAFGLIAETQKPVGEMTNTTNEIPLARMISPIDTLNAQISALKVDIANLKTEVDEMLELIKFIEKKYKNKARRSLSDPTPQGVTP